MSALVVVGLLALSGCTSGRSSGSAPVRPGPTAAPHAGSYPVATPPPVVFATQQASDDSYVLVAAGDPVRARIRDAAVLVRLSGPDVDVPPQTYGDPHEPHAPGVLTVSLTSERGRLTVPSSSFLGLGEEQDALRLVPDRPSVTVSPGHPGVVHLKGDFTSGHTTLTWQPTGHPMITWDFVVEID